MGMKHLITDRTQQNVNRWKELHDKGYADMTPVERIEWLGSPFSVANAGLAIVNLASDTNVDEGSSVIGKWDGDELVVTSSATGTYKYARLNLGAASLYENRTLTISFDDYEVDGTGQPGVRLYWVNSAGLTAVSGAVLDAPGTVTVNVGANTDNRDSLVLFVYATRDVSQTKKTRVRYKNLMVELGDTKHDFVPYYPVFPTSALRGSYNRDDMNRVEKAVVALSERMHEMGYHHDVLTTKTDWNYWSVPTRTDMVRYFGNVATLRGAIPVKRTTPAAPTVNGSFNYSRANDFERILADIDDILTGIPKAMYHAGEVFSGEV